MESLSRQRGLTLVELMISLTLGLLLMIGIGSIFVFTSRSSEQNTLIAGLQDQARFALSTLGRDLALAGYWGGLYGVSNIAPNLLDDDLTNDSTSATTALPAAADCGADATVAWTFALGRRLEFRNQDQTSPVWRCIGHQLGGTDTVALRRVAGRETAAMAATEAEVTLQPYHYYLKTNGVTGTLARWGATAKAAPNPLEAPLSAPLSFHRFEPRIYFVRDHLRSSGDGIPALCRKQLCASAYRAGDGQETASCGGGNASATGYYSECIAEGVEDFQISWGLDADNDGSVERYTSLPATGELEQARTAQLWLLVRSREADAQYTDPKTYQLGDKPAYTPADHYYRRVYSTTVLLHNRYQ